MIVKDSAFHVLYTDSITKTHDFFQKLGVEIKKVEDDKVVVELGDYDLHFILNTSEPFREYAYVAEKKDYGNGILFYTEVENIEDAFEKVKSAGGNIKSDIKPNHWECREFMFEDPNGYKFVFYQ